MLDIKKEIEGQLGGIKISFNTVSKIQNELNWIDDHVLTYGLQGSKGLSKYPNSDLNVATVALFQEFGTDTIPSRPFIRRTFKKKQKEINSKTEKEIGLVVSLTQTGQQAYQNIGKYVVGLIQDELKTSSSWAKRLDDKTIKDKGGKNSPLRDSDKLLKAISWAIRKGNSSGTIIATGGK